MRLFRARSWFVGCMLLASVVVAAADESLQDAYSAILRGDYKAGRAAVERLLEQSQPPDQATRVDRWLDAYQSVVSSREQLRQETFDWNVAQASEQLESSNELAAKGEADQARKKLYLALSFAAQASAYAADAKEYAAAPWIRELRAASLTAAEHFAQTDRWVKAHVFYMLLQQIDEHDAEVKSLRERAARHARLELIYGDNAELKRRIEAVNYDLLVMSLARINENYYSEPDFKKMAEGALDSLVALCTTTRLYQGSKAAGDFDGVADPVAREYFLGKLEQERRKLRERSDCTQSDLRALYNTVKEVNKASVSLPAGLLIVEFMEGALEQLDEFTSIIWPVDSDEFDKVMMGVFIGVGIQLGIDEASGRLKVVTPLEGSPALEAGIQPSDLIIEVDGESTKDWTTDKAVREITGEEGTGVTLTIYRPSVGKRIDFPLTRRPIRLTTIRGVERRAGQGDDSWDFMLDQDAGVAYIRLTNFNPDSQEELLKALAAAKDQGMRGLILDVRHNAGGLLNVAIGTVSTFLAEGLVVETRGREGREASQRISVSGDAEYADLPLVVLVNEQSASASEILAGALRDHQRAIVLGERTFGKGSVQQMYKLQRPFVFNNVPATARLKLTTALYYLPDGESPHKRPDAEKWGVDPDCVVKLTPKEFAKVLERERQAFIIHNEQEPEATVDANAREQELAALKIDQEEPPDEEEDLLSEEDIKLLRSDPYEAPDVDPQLVTALLQLRVKLAANLPWPRQLAKNTDQGDTP